MISRSIHPNYYFLLTQLITISCLFVRYSNNHAIRFVHVCWWWWWWWWWRWRWWFVWSYLPRRHNRWLANHSRSYVYMRENMVNNHKSIIHHPMTACHMITCHQSSTKTYITKYHTITTTTTITRSYIDIQHQFDAFKFMTSDTSRFDHLTTHICCFTVFMVDRP